MGNSDTPTVSRTNQIQNGSGIAPLSLDERSFKRIHFPDFKMIRTQIQSLNIALESLIQREEDGNYDPYEINIVALIDTCDLGYRNPAHLVSIITKDGIYGEIEKDGRTTNLTKEALRHLIAILEENTIEGFYALNKIQTSDFTNSRGVIAPITPGTLIQLLKYRGFDKFSGVNVSHIANAAIAVLQRGTDYTLASEGGNRLHHTMLLTQQALDTLVRTLNDRIVGSLRIRVINQVVQSSVHEMEVA